MGLDPYWAGSDRDKGATRGEKTAVLQESHEAAETRTIWVNNTFSTDTSVPNLTDVLIVRDLS